MALSQNMQPIKIFFSFASGTRRDKTLFEDLCKQLIPYKKQGYIEEWYDSMISVGANWQQAVNVYIYNADIIVFLISPEFLATDYYDDGVLQKIFDRYDAGTVRVLSVLLRQISDFGPFLDKSPFFPPDRRPIGGRSNKDRLLAEVAKEIHRVARELMNRINAHVFPGGPRSPLWNVPYRRNPLFIGREDILNTIHNYFADNQPSHTHIQALSGLGGIGKTQLAVEYAYRWYQHKYQAVFWIQAASRDIFNSNVVALAELLVLSERIGSDEEHLFQAVKQWLQAHSEWLLILDNLVDFTFIDLVIPAQCRGHVLLTTRHQATGGFIHAVPVTPLTLNESALFLLRRAKTIPEEATQDEIPETEYAQALSIASIVDGYPLALDQAGAYIEETGSSFAAYITLYQQRRAHLLRQRGQFPDEQHPDSVFTTLSLAFDRVGQAHPGAMALLQLFAFFHPDAIADEMIINGAPDLPPSLQILVADPVLFGDTIAILLRFSLVRRRADTTTSIIHRIVQAVLKDTLLLAQQREWAICVVRLVNRAFPEPTINAWPVCQRYLPQAQICAELIAEFSLTLEEATQLLSNMGEYCYERAMYAEAERYLSSALHIHEQVSGSEHSDTAASLNALALLHQQLGRYQQAELLLQRSLSIYEQVLGVDHSSTISVMNNLGRVYFDQNKQSLAETLYQRALLYYEQTSETDPCDIAIVLNNLAVLYHEQDKFALAELFYQRSLAIHEAVLPLDHPDLAQKLNNLAELYKDQGEYERAEPFYQRSLHIYEQTSGMEHPDTALSLNNLAGLYQKQGKYEQAEPLYQRVLHIYEQIFDTTHPNIAMSLNNLALLYRKQGSFLQAEHLYKRALAIYTQIFDEMHPDVAWTLNNLGRLYLLQGNYVEAEPLLIRAVTIYEQVLGQMHSETANSLGNLAELYTRLHRYEQAEPLYIRALIIYQEIYRKSHPDKTRLIEKYAHLLEEMQRTEEATTLLHAAHQIQEDPSNRSSDQIE